MAISRQKETQSQDYALLLFRLTLEDINDVDVDSTSQQCRVKSM